MTKVTVRSVNGFTEDQKIKMLRCLSLLERIINTNEFKEEVLKANFKKTEGYNNNEIYKMIMEGRESLDEIPDSEIDLYLNLSTDNPNELGHTSNQRDVYTGTQTFNDMEDWEYAGHVAHEYCHTLGFTHAFFPWPGRDKTVPYAIGYIVEGFGEK